MKKFIVVMTVLVLTSCGKFSQDKPGTGVIILMLGDVKIVHQDKAQRASAGDVFAAGDSLITGENSVAVASVNNGAAEFELQENSVFRFNKEREVEIAEGNLWLRVNRKLAGDGVYHLKTPAGVAAVRGTKMFAFQMFGITGICHCDGSVDYSSEKTGYSHRHNRDHFVVTRDGVTALLTAEDIPFIITPGDDHRHSVIENSPLGEKGDVMTPEKKKKFLKIIEAKLVQAKKDGR